MFQIPVQSIQGLGAAVTQAQQVAMSGQAIRLVNPIAQSGQIVRLGVPSGSGTNPQSTIRIAQIPKGINLSNGGIRLTNTSQLLAADGRTKIVHVARPAGSQTLPAAPVVALRAPGKASVATAPRTIQLPTVNTASGQQVVLLKNANGQIIHQPLSSLVSVVNQSSTRQPVAGAVNKTVSTPLTGQLVVQTKKQVVSPEGQLRLQHNQAAIPGNVNQLTGQTLQNIQILQKPNTTHQNTEEDT